VNYRDVHFKFCHKAYFSRLMRDRRTKGNAKQLVISTIDDDNKFDEEEQQLQEEEEEEKNNSDSALAVSEAHDSLDGAIHVLDEMNQQQQANSITQSNSSALSTGRISEGSRTSTRRK
jgi:ATP phosphoribosyltransferase regulatory subunit HisZ